MLIVKQRFMYFTRYDSAIKFVPKVLSQGAWHQVPSKHGVTYEGFGGECRLHINFMVLRDGSIDVLVFECIADHPIKVHLHHCYSVKESMRPLYDILAQIFSR